MNKFKVFIGILVLLIISSAIFVLFKTNFVKNDGQIEVIENDIVENIYEDVAIIPKEMMNSTDRNEIIIEKKQDEFELWEEEYRKQGYISDIVTIDNSYLYNGTPHSIYFHLKKNNCDIIVISNITDMISGWASHRAEKYLVIIKNEILETYIESEWISSTANATFYWLDDELFRMDFGSTIGPDSNSYFYSSKLNKISRNYFLATGYVDIMNKLVLCADDEFIVYDIYNPQLNYTLESENMRPVAMKWFIIGENTKFDNKGIFLEYMIDDEDFGKYETRFFDLSKIIK